MSKNMSTSKMFPFARFQQLLVQSKNFTRRVGVVLVSMEW
uniref:Uncharacterized protein n=1 Tax=Arundo donax TaxID=35708 RepID=A0A0A8YRI6_ARUDO